MTVSAISHYRGGHHRRSGALGRKTLKAAYLKHGIALWLSRFKPAQMPETGSSL